jgi:hypothetical protein
MPNKLASLRSNDPVEKFSPVQTMECRSARAFIPQQLTKHNEVQQQRLLFSFFSRVVVVFLY